MTDRASRLRIAFVVHDYNRHGGQNRYVVELATRFKRNHEVHVFANTFDDHDLDGIACHRVPALRTNSLSSALSFILPATILARGEYDIVHSQGLCGLSHNFATAHMCQPAWYKALADEGNLFTWKQQLYRRLVSRLERRALCQAATRRVVAVSNRMKADLSQHYGRSEHVDVVYHGTDVETFHPENRDRFGSEARDSLGIPRAAFAALYVGDLKKGVAAAIKAVAMTPGVHLVVLTASKFKFAQRLAETEGVGHRVLFRPHTKNIERCFAAADVFLFPTVYDSFGMVITEAMASGLPVIVSAAAGASELVTSGVDGFVNERSWDVPLIAKQLAELRDDRGLRERVGAQARRRIEPMTWQRTADETLQSYKLALA